METKGAKDAAYKPKSILYSQDKGHLSESEELWSELQLCCTSSAALICHQAQAVTTELLLHHPFVLPSEPTGGRGDSDWNLHINAPEQPLGMLHQSGTTAHPVKPALMLSQHTWKMT